MSFWKRAAGATLCLLIAASVAMNIGVCIPELRVLGDEDYIRSAIDVVIHDPLDAIVTEMPGRTIVKTVQSQVYARPDDLKHEFPDCCRIVTGMAGDSRQELGLLDRFLGVRLVEITYDKRYVEFGSQQSAGVKTRVAVTCCGHARPLR